jgi:hypothetical protein
MFYQELVVVEHGVEVLDPLRIDVAVEDDPLPLVDLAPHVVYDPTEDVREEAVAPLACVWVLGPILCISFGRNLQIKLN